MSDKPLGHKAYGSIGHLPGSRLGPGDHHVPVGQGHICTAKRRDKHDWVWVQEKLDGCCMSVAKIDGRIVALGRAGYTAASAPHEHMSYLGSGLSRSDKRSRGYSTRESGLWANGWPWHTAPGTW